MPKRVSTPVYITYNVVGLYICINGLIAIFSRTLPPELREAGHFQFLTNLSLIITIITIISNIVTVAFSNTLNTYLNAVSLVAETIVSLIYWPLRLFFLNMIVNTESMEKAALEFIPIRIDLSVHLFPIVFLSVDYYLFSADGFQIPLLNVLLVLVGMTISYWSLLNKLITPPNHYPYPFLNNVSTEQRLIIFVVIAVLGLIFYQIYEYIHAKFQQMVFSSSKAKTN